MEKINSLIQYLENTKEEDWIADKVRNKDGKGCLMSHVFDWGGGDDDGGSDAWDWFEECWATTFMVYPINDGENPKYTQISPRQRCIAYIKDLRDGKAKRTQDLWREWELERKQELLNPNK